jgi:hypothetical protein
MKRSRGWHSRLYPAFIIMSFLMKPFCLACDRRVFAFKRVHLGWSVFPPPCLQAAEVHRLENELRMLHTKHAGALAELKAQHQQEREGLQAQLEAKEREAAAAQEGIEAAERKLADSNREAVGKMDASADKVGCLAIGAGLGCDSVVHEQACWCA